MCVFLCVFAKLNFGRSYRRYAWLAGVELFFLEDDVDDKFVVSGVSVFLWCKKGQLKLVGSG